MFNNKKVTANRSWTSQELIQLSQSLAEAYLPGSSNERSRQ